MTDPTDPLRNIRDPFHKSGPDQAKALFQNFSRSSTGFSTSDVIGAAANVIIAALRQAHPRRGLAEASFDEIFGQSKQLLLNHYDGAGNRLNIFPFNQHIHAPHFDDRDKLNGAGVK